MHWSLHRAIVEDLSQRHAFALERVGFIQTKAANLSDGIIVLASAYIPVADENYVRDDFVGARINSAAIRAAMQVSLTNDAGIFHVHMHEHPGRPLPSKTDWDSDSKLMPDFFNVNAGQPHGTLILSHDHAFGLCWTSKSSEPRKFDQIIISGAPTRIYEGR
jgi:hypothetical protein